MQRAVQCRSMDQSTLVREAAVDLVGRFVLSRPELTSQYYDMLSERILVSKNTKVIDFILREKNREIEPGFTCGSFEYWSNTYHLSLLELALDRQSLSLKLNFLYVL